jgi:hypothetical protein
MTRGLKERELGARIANAQEVPSERLSPRSRCADLARLAVVVWVTFGARVRCVRPVRLRSAES